MPCNVSTGAPLASMTWPTSQQCSIRRCREPKLAVPCVRQRQRPPRHKAGAARGSPRLCAAATARCQLSPAAAPAAHLPEARPWRQARRSPASALVPAQAQAARKAANTAGVRTWRCRCVGFDGHRALMLGSHELAARLPCTHASMRWVRAGAQRVCRRVFYGTRKPFGIRKLTTMSNAASTSCSARCVWSGVGMLHAAPSACGAHVPKYSPAAVRRCDAAPQDDWVLSSKASCASAQAVRCASCHLRRRGDRGDLAVIWREASAAV